MFVAESTICPGAHLGMGGPGGRVIHMLVAVSTTCPGAHLGMGGPGRVMQVLV